MAVAMAVVEGALAAAEREGGGKIAAVHLRIGAVSGVDREALALALSVAAEGTGAAGANWLLTAVAARAWCGGCGAVREPVADYDLRCGDCGAWLEALRTGRELELTAIELEVRQAGGAATAETEAA